MKKIYSFLEKVKRKIYLINYLYEKIGFYYEKRVYRFRLCLAWIPY